jgi:prephenate dehydrogenase
MAGKVVICGVGLIGGSFALAIKSAMAGRQCPRIVGMGRTRAPLDEALRIGVIDEIGADWASALQGADLVLLGMPVGQMAPVMQALVPYLEPQTIVTDGGSTKADVVAAARAAFGDRVAQFVPGHPIAGAEKSGVSAAKAEIGRAHV